MRAALYWFPQSHPSWAVRKMLELKRIEVEERYVLPGMQRVHLRLARFRGGTVPAIVLGGSRIQGSRRIARALEVAVPDPPLLPADPALRAEVEEAERWGDEELQDVPRVILRWGLANDAALRRWIAADSGMPVPAVSARLSKPLARYYANLIGADDRAAREALARLPQMLERADELLERGVLELDPPNAATLQVLCTVRALDSFEDLHEQVSGHPVTAAARRLFPDFPGPVPRFI